MGPAWLLGALLALGVAIALLSALGVWRADDAYAKLHYAAPVGTLGVGAIALASMLQFGWSAASLKVVLLAVGLVVGNALIQHAIARAVWRREAAAEPGP